MMLDKYQQAAIKRLIARTEEQQKRWQGDVPILPNETISPDVLNMVEAETGTGSWEEEY
jgi:hypothetical protein